MVFQAYRDDVRIPIPRGRPLNRWVIQIREDTRVPIASADRRESDGHCGKGLLEWRARGVVVALAAEASKSSESLVTFESTFDLGS